jgi:preprotein translocase subunit YajC
MIDQSFLILAQAQQTPAQPGLGSMLIPFLCIAVIFYFLIIRPQKKKQKEAQELVASLKTGDKVVTAGGIHGLISNVKETSVILKIADNVKIEVEKASVSTVSKSAEPAAKPAA